MDMNGYALEILARDRLAELRAGSERVKLAVDAGRAAQPRRSALAHALIRLSRRLQGVRRKSVVTIANPNRRGGRTQWQAR